MGNPPAKPAARPARTPPAAAAHAPPPASVRLAECRAQAAPAAQRGRAQGGEPRHHRRPGGVLLAHDSPVARVGLSAHRYPQPQTQARRRADETVGRGGAVGLDPAKAVFLPHPAVRLDRQEKHVAARPDLSGRPGALPPRVRRRLRSFLDGGRRGPAGENRRNRGRRSRRGAGPAPAARLRAADSGSVPARPRARCRGRAGAAGGGRHQGRAAAHGADRDRRAAGGAGGGRAARAGHETLDDPARVRSQAVARALLPRPGPPRDHPERRPGQPRPAPSVRQRPV